MYFIKVEVKLKKKKFEFLIYYNMSFLFFNQSNYDFSWIKIISYPKLFPCADLEVQQYGGERILL